jgi:hypothetical protein
MKDWHEMPEAMGPQSEGAINNVAYGDPGYPSIGQAPRIMSVEQMNRERDDASRRYEVRLAAERAALQAGQSALEAAATADRLIREAQETARKVSG